jgi:hypothetical protein
MAATGLPGRRGRAHGALLQKPSRVGAARGRDRLAGSHGRAHGALLVRWEFDDWIVTIVGVFGEAVRSLRQLD